MIKKGQLPRLSREWYQGNAFVFWTFTLEDRRTGWLTPAFHALFREVLLHAAIRYRLLVPVYCLMPDHLHWVGVGLSAGSDQRNATAFLRKFLTVRSGGVPRWQRQPHDHVLTEERRERHAFVAACHYVLENPVRAELVSRASEWPFSGCMAPGYPVLSVHDPGYWSRFWKIYEESLE